jgi:hypothetical protein
MPPVLLALDLARRFAPGLVRLLKGPDAAAVAQTVLDTAAGVAGVPEPQEAAERLKQDPALAHAYAMRLLDLEELQAKLRAEDERDARQAGLADVGGARQRDVRLRELGQQNVRADRMVALAVWGLLGSVAALCALSYLKATYPDAINDGVFGALLTQITTIGSYFGLSLRDAFTFEFGSSRGSRMKDEALAKMDYSKQ